VNFRHKTTDNEYCILLPSNFFRRQNSFYHIFRMLINVRGGDYTLCAKSSCSIICCVPRLHTRPSVVFKASYETCSDLDRESPFLGSEKVCILFCRALISQVTIHQLVFRHGVPRRSYHCWLSVSLLYIQHRIYRMVTDLPAAFEPHRRLSGVSLAQNYLSVWVLLRMGKTWAVLPEDTWDAFESW
jgi:hypothetical protein